MSWEAGRRFVPSIAEVFEGLTQLAECLSECQLVRLKFVSTDIVERLFFFAFRQDRTHRVDQVERDTSRRDSLVDLGHDGVYIFCVMVMKRLARLYRVRAAVQR